MSAKEARLTATQALPADFFKGVRDKIHATKMRAEMNKVETLIHDNLHFTSPIANSTARYLAEAGGKRLRPLLTLITSELGDGPNENVRNAATSVELTHLASLYHDDVMDEAELRRGVDAAHIVWGNSVAILAGDLLFARASSLVASLGREIILLQAKTFERLCLGQLHETVGPQPGEDAKAHYMQVLADKTGALIASAARMGAILGGADDEYIEPVTEYGEKIGVAFQLVDDVLDLSADTDQTGKIAGTDLRAGVVTLPMLLLREEALTDAAAADLVARIDAGVKEIAAGAEITILDREVQELREHAVTAKTKAAAAKWAGEAVSAIETLPKSSVKASLQALADSILTREG